MLREYVDISGIVLTHEGNANETRVHAMCYVDTNKQIVSEGLKKLEEHILENALRLKSACEEKA